MSKEEIPKVRSVSRGSQADGHILTVEGKLLLRIARVFELHADEVLVSVGGHDDCSVEVHIVWCVKSGQHRSHNYPALDGGSRFRGADGLKVFSYHFFN